VIEIIDHNGSHVRSTNTRGREEEREPSGCGSSTNVD
jgi:hypothetical protein